MRLRSPRVSLLTLLFCSLVLGLTLFASRSLWGATLGNDLAVGFAFALFLFAVLQFATRESSPGYSAVAHHLAGFSYNLYVLHFPFLLFARNLLVPVERWQPAGIHLLSAAAVGAGCLLFAWGVSLFTEKKTDVARRRIKRFLA